MEDTLKRRNISGLYIFDTFPGEEKRQPTCIEDCQEETRRKWCLENDPETLKNSIVILCDAFNDLNNYIYEEKLITDKQKDMGEKMISDTKESLNQDWTLVGLADVIGSLSKKIRLIADRCGVIRS